MKILKNIYKEFKYMLECIEEIHDHLVDIKDNTEDILDYIEILVEKEKDQEIKQTLRKYFGEESIAGITKFFNNIKENKNED